MKKLYAACLPLEAKVHWKKISTKRVQATHFFSSKKQPILSLIESFCPSYMLLEVWVHTLTTFLAFFITCTNAAYRAVLLLCHIAVALDKLQVTVNYQ